MHVFCLLSHLICYIQHTGHRSTCSQKYMRHICRVFLSLSLLLSLSLSAEAVAVPEAAHASLPRLGSRWARPVRLFLSVWCKNMKLLRHLFNISHLTTGQSILSINFIPETCQIIKRVEIWYRSGRRGRRIVFVSSLTSAHAIRALFWGAISPSGTLRTICAITIVLFASTSPILVWTFPFRPVNKFYKKTRQFNGFFCLFFFGNF